MAIVVVGGSGKDVGKTALVCALIAALPEFAWTAVKITGHEYQPANDVGSNGEQQTVWEDSEPGQETDTARYLAAGARRALLVTRSGSDVPIEEIRRALGADRNVIFESNRIIDVIQPDVCLALLADAASEQKPSFGRLLEIADAVVSLGVEIQSPDVAHPPRRFRLQSSDRLTPEVVDWLRGRLGNDA